MRFRSKSLTSLLFAFLLALPMISVISKVIYVQSNKNAYESYSGNVKESEYVDVTQGLPKYDLYFSFNQSLNITEFLNNTASFTFENVEFINGNLNETYIENLENSTTFYLWYFNGLPYFKTDTITGNSSASSYNFTIKTDLIFYTQTTTTNQINNLFYRIIDNNSLDNVFEYAVDEIIKENNLGNIDFFSYFTSIFMLDNQVNNRYIGYVNYYLNYALMVSLAYLLFLMLMWFINFARRFLDRGMNYDW